MNNALVMIRSAMVDREPDAGGHWYSILVTTPDYDDYGEYQWPATVSTAATTALGRLR